MLVLLLVEHQLSNRYCCNLGYRYILEILEFKMMPGCQEESVASPPRQAPPDAKALRSDRQWDYCSGERRMHGDTYHTTRIHIHACRC